MITKPRTVGSVTHATVQTGTGFVGIRTADGTYAVRLYRTTEDSFPALAGVGEHCIAVGLDRDDHLLAVSAHPCFKHSASRVAMQIA